VTDPQGLKSTNVNKRQHRRVHHAVRRVGAGNRAAPAASVRGAEAKKSQAPARDCLSWSFIGFRWLFRLAKANKSQAEARKSQGGAAQALKDGKPRAANRSALTYPIDNFKEQPGRSQMRARPRMADEGHGTQFGTLQEQCQATFARTDALQRAYPNYFLDVKACIELVLETISRSRKSTTRSVLFWPRRDVVPR
jgi:hypothetical protein